MEHLYRRMRRGPDGPIDPIDQIMESVSSAMDCWRILRERVDVRTEKC